MRKALATLQFVERRSIQTDTSSHKVTVGLNDTSAFKLDEVIKALPAKYQKDVKVLEGPTPASS